MTKFRFECPVCKIAVNGRNARRHLRRVHVLDAPRDIHAFARRRSKEWMRDPKHWVRATSWVWLKGASQVIERSMAWVMSATKAAAVERAP